MSEPSRQPPPGPRDIDSHAETAPAGDDHESNVLMPPAQEQSQRRSGAAADHAEHGDVGPVTMEEQRDKHWPIPKR